MPRKRMVPLGAKERQKLATARRGIALQRQHANKVADAIFGRTKKVPNTKLVEGLPKSRREIESKLAFFKKFKMHAKQKEGHAKYGKEFLKLYDLFAKKAGVTFGKRISSQKGNQAYFPSPEIKMLISSLRKRIKADKSLDKKTKENSMYTLNSLSKQTQISRVVNQISTDRILLSRAIQTNPTTSYSQTLKLIKVFEEALKTTPEGKLTPVKLAELYIKLH